MKLRFLAMLGLIVILAGCNSSHYTDTTNIIEEYPESTLVDPKTETDLSVLDVMEQITSTYSDYNTFVFINDTVHIMNCIDSVNRTTAELAREISSITNSSYEVVSVRQVEDTTKLLSQKIRIDYISIEDSNGNWNQSTNDIVAFYQQDDEHMQRLYDRYEIVIRQSVPGITDYIGKEDATITELMEKIEPNAFAGFVVLSTDDNKQMFIFPHSSFDYTFSKDTLTIQIWETANPAEVSSYQRDIVDTAVDFFMGSMFWMPGYKELFLDVLPAEILDKYNDNKINVSDFKKLVNWKATAYIADGITDDDYETRLNFVESSFDYAINKICSSTDSYQCEITYDYTQCPAVIALSDEPYYSLFIREVEHFFETSKQQIEASLSASINSENVPILDAFIQEMLYGEGESRYNVFMDYELFYGPQTEEQMRQVLEDYKNLVRETVYEVFAKSYDHLILETAIQNAHTEMDSWWDTYLRQNNE